MNRQDTPDTPLSGVLDENIAVIRRMTGDSSDIVINRFTAGGIDCALIGCDGMFSSSVLTDLVAEPLTALPRQKDAHELIHHVSRYMMLSADRAEVPGTDTLFRLIYSGFAVLMADGCSKALGFGVQGFASRSIQEPSGEGNVMGSHDGFTETIRINMSLVRRRLRSPDLVTELFTKGKKSRTDLCLCYMKDRVPAELISRIKRSLDNMQTEAVLTTGYIRTFLEEEGFRIFSPTGVTERPDVLCSKLIEGRAAILCDGIPYAVFVPKLFCENFQTLDDYAMKPYYATLIRWLKYLAFLLAVLLPAVYAAIVMYHPELLNSTMLMLLVKAEEKAPLSIFTETAGVLLMYEIIREAGIRLPEPVGGAVSIVSGLIIGDSAVKSGLISTPLLTISALSVIGGFVVPELHQSVTVLRLAFLTAGGLFGLFGISLLACAVLVNICATEDYGFPYTSPLSPFRKRGMGDTFIRSDLRKTQNRDFTVEEYQE